MNAKEKAEALVRKNRKYVKHSLSRGIVEKTFNNGMGSLALYRFSGGNKVVANTVVEKKADRSRLLALFPGSDIIEVELGYPEYYLKTLPNPDTL